MAISKLKRFGKRVCTLHCSRGDVSHRLDSVLSLPERKKSGEPNKFILASVPKLFPGREVLLTFEETKRIGNILPSAYWRWYRKVKPSIDSFRVFTFPDRTNIARFLAPKAGIDKEALRFYREHIPYPFNSDYSKGKPHKVVASATTGFRTSSRVTRDLREGSSESKTRLEPPEYFQFESVDPDTGRIVRHNMDEYDSPNERKIWKNQMTFKETLETKILPLTEDNLRVLTWSSELPPRSHFEDPGPDAYWSGPSEGYTDIDSDYDRWKAAGKPNR